MNVTPIEWTDFSANPLKYRDKDGKVVWGCVHESPGCLHCYSEALAKRYGRGGPFNVPTMNGLTPFLDEDEQHKMRTAKVIGGKAVSGGKCFIGDMTDIFGEWVSDDLLNHLFSETLELRTDVTWQILTKRAERMQKYLSWRWGGGRIPSRHIHIGVSVENQKYADERIQLLLQTPAAIRFISAEPLIGPVNLRGHFFSPEIRQPGKCAACGNGHGFTRCPNYGSIAQTYQHQRGGPVVCEQFQKVPGSGIDWVIVGGESGPGARTFDTSFARSIVKQCADAGVACFVKQLGAKPEQPSHGAWNSAHREPMILRDRKGGDMNEWPIDLRVRQFPAVSA